MPRLRHTVEQIQIDRAGTREKHSNRAHDMRSVAVGSACSELSCEPKFWLRLVAELRTICRVLP
jgi:hypothetical protein